MKLIKHEEDVRESDLEELESIWNNIITFNKNVEKRLKTAPNDTYDPKTRVYDQEMLSFAFSIFFMTLWMRWDFLSRSSKTFKSEFEGFYGNTIDITFTIPIALSTRPR